MGPRHDRERLIDEVKKYSVLYDTQHASHRDNDVRDQCWAKIAEKLGIDSDNAKREWKILRDSLRQALKREKKAAKGEVVRPWRFQKRMEFIVPHMNLRPARRAPLRALAIKPDSEASDGEPPADLFDRRPPPPADDALDLFFASVCQSTRRLPTRHQNQVKKLVLDALLKVEGDYEQEQEDNKDGLYKY